MNRPPASRGAWTVGREYEIVHDTLGTFRAKLQTQSLDWATWEITAGVAHKISRSYGPGEEITLRKASMRVYELPPGGSTE